MGPFDEMCGVQFPVLIKALHQGSWPLRFIPAHLAPRGAGQPQSERRAGRMPTGGSNLKASTRVFCHAHFAGCPLSLELKNKSVSLRSHGAQGAFPFEGLTLSSHHDEVSLSGSYCGPFSGPTSQAESGSSAVSALGSLGTIS